MKLSALPSKALASSMLTHELTLRSPFVRRVSTALGSVAAASRFVSHREIELSWVRLPSWLGIGPLNLLLLRKRDRRRVRLPSWLGIGPLNWLSLSQRDWRLVRLPSWLGIGPLNLFSWRRTVSRLVRLPSWLGIVPVNSLL